VKAELLRATIFHTPRNAFREDALEAHIDGGLLIRDGKVVGCGEFEALRKADPDAEVKDWRGGFVLPGLIDTHIHFPQVRVIGSLGLSLLEWLEQAALPEESRMADARYAGHTAQTFVRALAANGTTTALVFGSHFAPATACLFEAAAAIGVRVVSGLVVSDRLLLPELHQTPDAAYRDSTALIREFHGPSRSIYAVTPRFALSTSEAMLEMCQTLLREHTGVRFQTHLNENRQEIAEVARLFPGAQDYLQVYERFGLTGSRCVMAHNVHPCGSELERMAGTDTSVAHCPSSNAALGSGLFPMRSHVAAGVRFGLGTDVGAGTSFSLLREGLQAYLMQRVMTDGMLLTGAQLLYLATRAGAEALGVSDEVGDFSAGKSADFVYVRPRAGTPFAAGVENAPDAEKMLTKVFTLADADCIREVRVEGAMIYDGRSAGREACGTDGS
jgi:guanine deaminase